MVDLLESDLVNVLNSFSNEISLKILKTYEQNTDGLNLTNNSKIIEEKTTTVKDHLIKLKDSNLIHIQNKKYYLSYFGALILEYVKNIEILNNTRKIFGYFSSDIIPIKFIIKFVPFLKGVKVFSNQWAYMNVGNKVIEMIKNTNGDEKSELKVIGWNSIPIGLDVMRGSFNNITTEREAIKKFFIDTNLRIITDKSVLTNIGENDQTKDLDTFPGIKERVSICQNIEKFNFILVRYNKYITFFLNISQEAGPGPYFIIKSKPNDKPNAIDIFEEIFEYFTEKSIPLSEIPREYLKFLEK